MRSGTPTTGSLIGALGALATPAPELAAECLELSEVMARAFQEEERRRWASADPHVGAVDRSLVQRCVRIVGRTYELCASRERGDRDLAFASRCVAVATRRLGLSTGEPGPEEPILAGAWAERGVALPALLGPGGSLRLAGRVLVHVHVDEPALATLRHAAEAATPALREALQGIAAHAERLCALRLAAELLGALPPPAIDVFRLVLQLRDLLCARRDQPSDQELVEALLRADVEARLAVSLGCDVRPAPPPWRPEDFADVRWQPGAAERGVLVSVLGLPLVDQAGTVLRLGVRAVASAGPASAVDRAC